MRSGSLAAWLDETIERDALLSSWRRAVDDPIRVDESQALGIAALACRARIDAVIEQPGGRSRLPLLAAAHSAALQLQGFPSPFAPRRVGPTVLATRQVVRRGELLKLDAAGVPISPALHPVRLRADGLCVSLRGGRPQPQFPEHRLLFAREFTTPMQCPPAVVIIDAAVEEAPFVDEAAQWGRAQGASVLVFEDVARGRWRDAPLVHSAGWAAINAVIDSSDPLTKVAASRGHLAVHDVGALPSLASAVGIFADAAQRGPFPVPLAEAAMLWRRLDELAVPIKQYDASCPRWHTPTLSERLDDLAAISAASFPPPWRAWAETCWANIKESIAATRSALETRNPKSLALAAIVDDELATGHDVDLALPSRTARDAVNRYLAECGVRMPVDGRLSVRSLGDPEVWQARRATLLVAPPTRRLRHRMTAADVGLANVLCYAHEVGALRAAVTYNLAEPLMPLGRITDVLPPALEVEVDLPVSQPQVNFTFIGFSPNAPARHRLSHLLDAVDTAALAAIAATEASGPAELPGDADGSDLLDEPAPTRSRTDGHDSVRLTVAAFVSDVEHVITVPVNRSVTRVLAGTTSKISVLDVTESMLVADLVGPTVFDRLRPLLLESRGPLARMLLAAWEQALTSALQESGTLASLVESLHGLGSRVKAKAVGEWADADRIGPRDPNDVRRIGQLGRHSVVTGEATAIAAVMQHLRSIHQAVGREVAGAITSDADAVGQIEQLLGADAASIIAETVIYRVVAVERLKPVPPTTAHLAPEKTE